MKSLHHSFDTFLAERFGIEEALLIHHFQHWISLNYRTGKNYIEGRTWTYQTMESIANHFPYLNRRKIKYSINSLVDQGVLLKNSFNKSRMDRTIWYSFVDEDYFIPKNIHDGQFSPSMDKKGRSIHESVHAIPDTKNIYINKKKESKPKKVEKDSSLKKSGHSPLASNKAHPSLPLFKNEIIKNVSVTSAEHEKLEKKLSKKIRDECYKILSDWKEDTPKSKWKKSDYRSILRWVVDAYKEKENKESKYQEVKTPAENKKFAEKIALSYSKIRCKQLKIRINVNNNEIEFIPLNNPTKCIIIQYDTKKFKDKLDQVIRKLGL